eukprot:scaffold12069_cov52-Phaeocystis_antarctica.AAC.1
MLLLVSKAASQAQRCARFERAATVSRGNKEVTRDFFRWARTRAACARSRPARGADAADAAAGGGAADLPLLRAVAKWPCCGWKDKHVWRYTTPTLRPNSAPYG